MRENTFREDLLYRLNVVNLRLPSLRERPQDILTLADFFIRKYSAANGVAVKPFSVQARQRLITHNWPGNVRELENAMHRAVLLSVGHEIEEDAIRLPDGLPLSMAGGIATGSAIAAQAAQTAEHIVRSYIGRTVAEVEQDLILQTLDHCLGNRTHAANILGISIRTLRNKLKEYAESGVQVPGPGANAA